MPEWIHDRVTHIKAKNPDMPEGEAWGIATNQAHALGKSPKNYGTAEGRANAKQIYKTPADDEHKANPKMEKKSAEIMVAALLDELDKIAAMPPPLPAAARLAGMAKALPKPKLYGEEGFQALMHGAKGAPNPFQSMKMGAAKLSFEQAVKEAGAIDCAKTVGKHILEHGAEAIHGFAKNRLDPALDAGTGLALGDTKRIAHGAGGIASGALLYHSGRKTGRLEEAEKFKSKSKKGAALEATAYP